MGFRLDLHNHTNVSTDGLLSPRQLLERAGARGIDLIGVTDHDEFAGAEECVRMSQEDPRLPRVIAGQEITTSCGELIGLYLTERIPEGLSPEQTTASIQAQGGIVYLPHPYDTHRRSTMGRQHVEQLALSCDVIEVRNGRILDPAFDRQALALAARSGALLGAGSDAHYAGEVGRVYVELTELPSRTTFLRLMRLARPVPEAGLRDTLLSRGYRLRTGANKARRFIHPV